MPRRGLGACCGAGRFGAANSANRRQIGSEPAIVRCDTILNRRRAGAVFARAAFWGSGRPDFGLWTRCLGGNIVLRDPIIFLEGLLWPLLHLPAPAPRWLPPP